MNHTSKSVNNQRTCFEILKYNLFSHIMSYLFIVSIKKTTIFKENFNKLINGILVDPQKICHDRYQVSMSKYASYLCLT